MPKLIHVEGLPEPVADAIAETYLSPENLRDLPSRPGTVIGTLRRVEIYEERCANTANIESMSGGILETTEN